MTPLLFAVARGNYEVAVLLVERGADLKQRDLDGFGVLHAAAQGGEPRIVEFPLTKGMDVHERAADGSTPLHLAMLARTTDVAKVLLTKGAAADVDAMDTRGMTPAAVARLIDRVEHEQLLSGKSSQVSEPRVLKADDTLAPLRHTNDREIIALIGGCPIVVRT